MRLSGSLRARLFIPIAVFASALAALMVWAPVQIHGADMKRANFDRALLFANLAATGVADDMWQTGGRDIAPLLAALKQHRPGIEEVSVTDSRGTVRHSSEDALVDTELAVDGLDWTRPVETEDAFAVVRPMLNEPRCAACHQAESQLNGWLVVRFSKSSIEAANQKLATTLLLTVLPALALLLGMTLWVLRREAIRPIERIVAAMRAAQAGDGSVRADEGRPDEIGVAARNFDATMAALQTSRSELEKSYELRMIRADRFAMVGEMATGLAHEIKNPLAGLSGALELLAEDLRDTHHGAMVHEMQHQVSRLGTIMEGMLSFARPPKAQLRSTDVNRVLEKVLFLVSRQRGSSRVEVVPAFDPALPPVKADPAQLEQVFLNVCLNAFEAMNGKGGRLTVRTSCDDAFVRIDVQDEGPGIPEHVRPHIFTPFFTTRPNGNGLGLAITARLIGEHGGHVDFDCPPEGGTILSITLPVEQPTAASKAPASREAA